MKKNKVLEAYKQKRINSLNEEQSQVYKEKILENLKIELETGKDRFLFIIPDIDVVNPLLKLMYDLALESHKNGYNTVILHEKDGFKPSWLKAVLSDYNDLKVDYLAIKAGSKSNKLKAGYQFKITDSIFIPDINLELVQDLAHDKQFMSIQKTLIVTGYSGLYTLNPGSSLYHSGIHNTIIFDDQVYQDYLDLFPGVVHHKIASYKIQNYDKANLKIDEIKKKEPYIVLTGVGNGEKLNQIVNIFYNKYPLLNFIKLKIIGRNSLAYYINDIKNAILFIDFDRQYVTNFNSLLSWQLNVPYFSTNGFVENIDKNITNNLLSPTGSIDLFQIVDYIKNILVNYINNTTLSLKETLVPNNEIIKQLDGIFELGTKKVLEDIRNNKLERLKNIFE